MGSANSGNGIASACHHQAPQPRPVAPHCLPCRPLSARRRTTVDEVQAVAQAGLDFIRNNVSINSIITGEWVDGWVDGGERLVRGWWGEAHGWMDGWWGEAGQALAPWVGLNVMSADAQSSMSCGLMRLPPVPPLFPPAPGCPGADRVDRLRPEEQLTLKVASVLGLTIYRQLLQVREWVDR